MILVVQFFRPSVGAIDCLAAYLVGFSCDQYVSIVRDPRGGREDERRDYAPSTHASTHTSILKVAERSREGREMSPLSVVSLMHRYWYHRGEPAAGSVKPRWP